MDEHELYGVPRERFIAERNALAKALRADGRREEAAGVAALRKPSVAAATVNQLVRDESDRLAALLQAGDALRTAQDRMLSGDGTAEELRGAVDAERAAVDALVSVAAHQGMSPSVSDRVAATLHAAALDEEARGRVSGGRLVEELQHVGFGAGSLSAGPATAKPASAQPPGEPARRRQADATSPSRAEAKGEQEREQAEQRRAAEERKLARHAERETRRRLDAAERALANAEQHHSRMRAELQDAEDKLEAARAEATAASAAHDAAQQALGALPPATRR